MYVRTSIKLQYFINCNRYIKEAFTYLISLSKNNLHLSYLKCKLQELFE